MGKRRLTPEEKELRRLQNIEYQREYRKQHFKRLSAHKAKKAAEAQQEGLKHYGSKCSCCGETEPQFLTIEHLDGRDKSIKRRTGKHEWARLKAQGWPTNITLLCFNCNCAKGAYGSCPHTRKEVDNA